MPAFFASQITFDAVPEAGVYPRYGHQDHAEHEEREDPREGVELAQIIEEQLADAEQEDGQAGEPQSAVAQREAGGQQRGAFDAPGDRQQAAGNFLEQERGRSTVASSE